VKRTGPLEPGEQVILIDARGRRYLFQLRSGGSFHSHGGLLSHDELIGLQEGTTVYASAGKQFLVLRPTLKDVVFEMPRGAQVIYPKDLATIVMVAGIAKGSKVVEAGVGSGALSMAMLQVGAEVTGYEIRDDFARLAKSNVERFLGTGQPYVVKLADIYQGIEETELDCVALDLPEPWQVVGHAHRSLHPGGSLVAYLPTINQTEQFRRELQRASFAAIETLEVLERTWHIEGRSVRPDHRMVAHTGFITVARKVSPVR
jgi:tRNA (adenine57-N1/adenine58-N1)-methyltransferase